MKISINQDATVCQRGNQTEFMIKTLVSEDSKARKYE